MHRNLKKYPVSLQLIIPLLDETQAKFKSTPLISRLYSKLSSHEYEIVWYQNMNDIQTLTYEIYSGLGGSQTTRNLIKAWPK